MTLLINRQPPTEDRVQFQTLTEVGKLISRSSLQMTVVAADVAVAMVIIMSWSTCLYSLGFPKEVQYMVQFYPFYGNNLLSGKTYDSLHMLMKKYMKSSRGV